MLDPGWTDYSKRVLFASYDITSALCKGENVIGVIVGNGWYGIPKLIAQIMILYEDGSTETIATGRDQVFEPRWTVARSPIIMNSVYDGETYDARLEKPGWDAPGFNQTHSHADELKWWMMRSVPVEAPGGKLIPQDMEPITIVGSLKAISIEQIAPGVYVFDFGQNIAGWCALRVSGKRGDTVVMRFAEILNDNGSVDQSNLRSAQATDTYILKGETTEAWEPRFTYHGFRYVQVEGLPSVPDGTTLTAKIVRSSVEPAGTFSCSDVLITQINTNARWTEGNNVHSLPTDCPQRDERMGWLNDLTVRAEAAVHHFNFARLYSKFMDDITDTQDAAGAISDTAPFKWGNRPADPVDVSYALLPWILYTNYGDTRTMARHYPHLQKLFNYLSSLAKNDRLEHSLYGDWSPPIAEGKDGSPRPANTPGALISTGYFLYFARILSQIAKTIGKHRDAKRYALRESEITCVFNQQFWNEEHGVYGSGNQASNVFPLWLGIVSAERKARVLAAVINDLKAHDMHITTGNLCTRYLFEVLSREGRSDIAVDVLTQRTYPSYGFMIDNGATTIWERWEKGGTEMNSYNHPMYASVAVWMHRYLAGIAVDETSSGFSRAIIKPHIPPQITHAEATITTVRGTIAVSWRKDNDTFTLDVTIPPNMTASIILPKQYAGVITESGTTVWEHGKRNTVPGIKRITAGIDGVILETGCGCFQIRSNQG